MAADRDQPGNQTARLQTILDVARAMVENRRLDPLLELIVAEAAKVVAADRCSLFLVDRERAELWSKVAQGSVSCRRSRGAGPSLGRVPEIAHGHHERLDGTGYPRGATGDAISIESRIMAIADIFDALTAADRPYKKAVPLEKALAILRAEAAEGRIDAALLEVFVDQQIYREVLSAQDGS